MILSLKLISTFWVLGKPAFFYPFLLFKDLFDGPEGGEGKYSQEGSQHNVFRAEGGDEATDSQNQENPPTLGAPIVLGLYDYGMKQADNEKRADADDKS